MIWIIEPHSDDAFLSLHTHIAEVWQSPKTIVTVYGNVKRNKEARNYAEKVGASHISLGYEEGGGLNHDAGNLPPFEEWGLDIRSTDTVLFPIGLQHPEHIAVRNRCPDRKLGLRFYLDTPYYAKQKVREEFNEKLRGMLIVSVLYASATKWKHIPIFKSQGRYFFHHPPESIPRIEMVLKLSQ